MLPNKPNKNMELENLRDSWRAANEAGAPLCGRSEDDLQRIAARVAAGNVHTSVQRLLLRWRLCSIVLVLLPVQLLPQLQGGVAAIRYAAWGLLGIFVAAACTRIFRLQHLVRRIDPATRSLRDTCTAVVRLRRCFLRGVAVNTTLAVLLLGTIALHQWQLHRAHWLYGFGLGLCIGIPLGIRLFFRMLQELELLSDALRNLDETPRA